jgi:TRAP-type mannitol/chloroaromatic compound transport system permease small subunit
LNLLKKLVKIIDSITIVVFKICKWILLPLVIIVVYEVISRYFFNSPHIWALETTTFLGGAFFMLSIPYVTFKGKHVNIDILQNYMSPKAKAIVDIITYVLFYCVFSWILLVYGTRFAANSWVTLERSWSSWAPPLYYIKTVVPVAAFLFLLQGIAIILRKIIFLVEEEEV